MSAYSYEGCRCCLNNGVFKDLWAEYMNDGERENYGEMLADCFGLPWQPPMDHTEQICDLCITSLKNAFSFKQKILTSEVILMQQDPAAESDEGQEQKPNMNNLKYEIHVKSEQSNEEDGNPYDDDDDNDPEFFVDMEEVDNQWSSSEDRENTDSQYLEVEYLEDDLDPTAPAPGSSRTSKRRKRNTKKSYKNYSESALVKAMDAVKSNLMTRSEASLYYDVPIKTIQGRLTREATKAVAPNDEEKQQMHDKQQKFNKEILTVLTYTNSTPYRTKTGRYYCAYCPTDTGRFYEDPDELRTHTRTTHASERLRSVDAFMKPYCLNEVMKLDIVDLICIVCNTKIESWNNMFEHLKLKHDVDLDEAYTRIIPYKLTDKLGCALCSDQFEKYHILDGHMNAHYNNYICGECGDTFLAENRLKKHVETHSSDRFPCTHCDKVFAREIYRKKHFDLVHTPAVPKMKCAYCTQKFRTEYARHLHQVEKHGQRVKALTCRICGKSFDWPPYYHKHMRITHGNKEKKYKCSRCDKSFLMPYQLKNHEDWHDGGVKHECAICRRKFSSKQYMQKHYLVHLNMEMDESGEVTLLDS